MKRDKNTRQALKNLSAEESQLFGVLESFEQGEILEVLELCRAIKKTPSLIAFSCLSGDGASRLFRCHDGLLSHSVRNRLVKFLDEIASTGYPGHLTVFVDDCEPLRVWQWPGVQADFTRQCRAALAKVPVPESWQVCLWSDFESGVDVSYGSVLEEVSKPRYALLISQTLQHMRKFPNQKLVGSVEEAAKRRVANYALQGLVLEEKMPGSVLCQTETPWSVKDSIINPLRVQKLPIIHPFFEERR